MPCFHIDLVIICAPFVEIFSRLTLSTAWMLFLASHPSWDVIRIPRSSQGQVENVAKSPPETGFRRHKRPRVTGNENFSRSFQGHDLISRCSPEKIAKGPPGGPSSDLMPETASTQWITHVRASLILRTFQTRDPVIVTKAFIIMSGQSWSIARLCGHLML